MQTAEPYTVEIEGFLLAEFYEKGATVHLTERQAHTFLLEGRVSKGAPKAQPKPAKVD